MFRIWCENGPKTEIQIPLIAYSLLKNQQFRSSLELLPTPGRLKIVRFFNVDLVLVALTSTPRLHRSRNTSLQPYSEITRHHWVSGQPYCTRIAQ